MSGYQPMYGKVTKIENYPVGTRGVAGCYQIMSVAGSDGWITNFVISPNTYFIDGAVISPSDNVVVFYDINFAAPLIFPPQYRAEVVARQAKGRTVAVDYFDENLVNSKGLLKLQITPSTRIMLKNGQRFTISPTNRHLIVVYGASTKSLPEIARPTQIIVICR